MKPQIDSLVGIDSRKYANYRRPERKNVSSERNKQFWVYCKNCGSTLYGTTDCTSSPVSICPICESKLVISSGYYYVCNISRGYSGKKTFYNKQDLKIIECSYEEAGKSEADLQLIDSSNSGKTYLKRVRDQLRVSNAKKKVLSFIKKNDIAVVKQRSNLSSETEKIDLKEYVHFALRIETEILSVEKRLEELYLLKDKNDSVISPMLFYLNNQKELLFTEKLKNAKEEINKKYFASISMPKVVLEKPEPFSEVRPIPPVMPPEPVYENPSFFNKKKVCIQNEILRDQYEESLKQFRMEEAAYRFALQEYEEKEREAQKKQLCYENTIKRMKREVEKEYKKQVSAAKAKAEQEIKAFEEALIAEDEKREVIISEQIVNHYLNNEIKVAEKVLKQLFKCKNDLYSYSIIYKKYQEPVALAAFYEYLSSGRCSSLEGYDGAYNLFESEQRSNIIISKLNDVLESLEEIKSNLRAIYNLMVEMKKDLESLNQKTDELIHTVHAIEKNTASTLESVDKLGATAISMNAQLEGITKTGKVIAYNTAVSAYYSKVNAELTNALGYMLAFK